MHRHSVVPLALAMVLVSLPLLARGQSTAGEPAGAFHLVRFPQPIPAPTFAAGVPGSGSLRLADYRGRYVLLNFWASWCVPCVQEMPSLERLYRTLGPRRLVVIGLSQDDTGARNAVPLIHTLGLSFPIALDSGRYGVSVLPSTFLIDPQGRVVAAANGGREWDSPPALAYFSALTGAPSSP